MCISCFMFLLSLEVVLVRLTTVEIFPLSYRLFMCCEYET